MKTTSTPPFLQKASPSFNLVDCVVQKRTHYPLVAIYISIKWNNTSGLSVALAPFQGLNSHKSSKFITESSGERCSRGTLSCWPLYFNPYVCSVPLRREVDCGNDLFLLISVKQWNTLPIILPKAKYRQRWDEMEIFIHFWWKGIDISLIEK